MPCDPSMADKASQIFTHRKRGAKTIARFQCKSLRMLPCLNEQRRRLHDSIYIAKHETSLKKEMIHVRHLYTSMKRSRCFVCGRG